VWCIVILNIDIYIFLCLKYVCLCLFMLSDAYLMISLNIYQFYWGRKIPDFCVNFSMNVAIVTELL
jgi:hypothetical protein